jgi:hypothetical protein
MVCSVSSGDVLCFADHTYKHGTWKKKQHLHLGILGIFGKIAVVSIA